VHLLSLPANRADTTYGRAAVMRIQKLGRLVAPALALAVVVGCAARGPTARVAPPPPLAVPEASPTLVRVVMAEAQALLGRPYRLGGADPSGFDCSGFVSYVYGRAGVGLPRTVSSLSTTGVGLPPGRAAAGDLLFFRTSSAGPSHVAIALGDGRFVHAPSSRGVVRIERLDAAYWARRYLWARRVLPSTQPRQATVSSPRP
jgi:cell wall-associated NlpC family hydrolase